MAGKRTKTVQITTNEGVISFPRVFPSTKSKKESDGSDQYDLQFLIPKSDREGCKAIMAAIKEVGLDAFGENWKKHRIPFRDGDKEADNIATDGQTNGEKYPERLGHYFFNAKSSKPVGVYDRQKNLIVDPDVLHGGCKGRIALSVYSYNSNGNVGVGMGLDGVQKTGEGEYLGGGAKPSVDSMFDMLADEEDAGLDDLAEETPAPAPAKKAAAKKTTAKKAAEPEPVEVEDSDDDLLPDDDTGADLDAFDDLD